MEYMSISQRKKEKNKSFIFAIFLGMSVFLSLPQNTHAATLNVSPSNGSFAVGKTFSVSFSVSSNSQSINAVSGNFTFSKENLEIIGVSKSSSIISLWSPGGEPQYSNSSGTGSFEGIITNPGFIGGSGKIVSYTFRVKNTGTGTVRVTTASILANDGNGTNVFTGSTTGTFTFVAAEKPILPKPVTPSTSPVKIQTPVQTDPQPLASVGALEIQELSKENNQLRFKISVRNSTKTIEKYEIRINQNEPVVWEDINKDGIFTTPVLPTGSYTLLVKLLDTSTPITGYLDFTVAEGLSKPVLLYYSKYNHLGQQPLVAYGTHNGSGTVTLLVKKGENVEYSETVVIDPQNRFLFVITDKIPVGEYTLEFFAQDEFGTQSEHTTPVKIYIKRYSYIDLGIGTIPVNLAVTMSTLLAIIGWVVVYIYHRKYTFRG